MSSAAEGLSFTTVSLHRQSAESAAWSGRGNHRHMRLLYRHSSPSPITRPTLFLQTALLHILGHDPAQKLKASLPRCRRNARVGLPGDMSKMIEKINDLTHVTNEITRGDGRVSD